MDKKKQLYLSLCCFTLLLAGSLTFYSCTKSPVSPIEPVNYVEPTILPQFSGQVTNSNTGAAIVGATVNLGGTTKTTDAQGNFTYDAQLTPGATTLNIQATGYISSSVSVDIPAVGESVYRNYQLAETSAPVIITAATGGTVDEPSDEGTVETTIPPGAVTTDTPVSVTSTLGASSPVDVSNVVTAVDEAPAQNVVVEPQTIQFAQPVEMKAPLSFPAEYLTGAMDVIRINPTTHAEEVVGTATVVDGKFVYDITQGGQYIVKAKTNLRHTTQTVKEAVLIGSIGFNERPGTFKTFTHTAETRIDADAGFSENFLEGVYGFSDASKTENYGVQKLTGSNNAIKAYVVVEKTIHTYSTVGGRVVAKVTATNTGSVGNGLGNYEAKWSSSTTHGTSSTTFLGWWSAAASRYLTTSEINNLGLPNPPPAP